LTIARENRITRSDIEPGMANVPWDVDLGYSKHVDPLTGDAGDYAHWQDDSTEFDWQHSSQEEQNLSDQALIITGISIEISSPPSIYSDDNRRLGGRGLKHHPLIYIKEFDSVRKHWTHTTILVDEERLR